MILCLPSNGNDSMHSIICYYNLNEHQVDSLRLPARKQEDQSQASHHCTTSSCYFPTHRVDQQSHQRSKRYHRTVPYGCIDPSLHFGEFVAPAGYNRSVGRVGIHSQSDRNSYSIRINGAEQRIETLCTLLAKETTDPYVKKCQS